MKINQTMAQLLSYRARGLNWKKRGSIKNIHLVLIWFDFSKEDHSPNACSSIPVSPMQVQVRQLRARSSS